MKFIHISTSLISSSNIPPDMTSQIHLFTQFFIPRDSQRKQEIMTCLRNNLNNPYITHIHLLNERIYTNKEMGIEDIDCSKLVQVNIKNRVQFKDVFKYVQENNIQGFLMLSNIDIFFDSTLKHLYSSPLEFNKMILMQLRYEYRSHHKTLDECPIFGPRSDSQDTWILHSNFMMDTSYWKAFSIEFGKPGCDNKLVYLFKCLGYDVVNDPSFVKTYHYHTSPTRNYTIKDQEPPPWGVICPAGYDPYQLPPTLGINMQHIKQCNQQLSFDDNKILYDFLVENMDKQHPVIIPRIAGIENNVAVFAQFPETMSRIQHILPHMKNNAGIKISNTESLQIYSESYLKAFFNAKLFCGWDVQGNYIGHIAQSHEIIKHMFPNRQMIWTMTLDIFHYIGGSTKNDVSCMQTSLAPYGRPWTHALRKQRILLISPFEETLQEQIPIREYIYGIDLFPDCSFVTIKPPMTQASEESLEFHKELELFYKRLDLIKHDYDVALVSCGGYGNIVCNYIYENHHKSAIYIGGVLQMYFGILGNRWLKERPDILRLYMNQYWKRPKVTERPTGCERVEGACYW